jgi:hypothetical protein
LKNGNNIKLHEHKKYYFAFARAIKDANGLFTTTGAEATSGIGTFADAAAGSSAFEKEGPVCASFSVDFWFHSEASIRPLILVPTDAVLSATLIIECLADAGIRKAFSLSYVSSDWSPSMSANWVCAATGA